MLQLIFTQLLQHYTSNENLAQQLWAEVEKHYQSKGRHYHTLQHLQNMHTQLLPVKDKIEDWNTMLFSLFYHDIIYKVTRKDNEEQSAELAEKHLQQLGYPQEKILLCKQQIGATKSHTVSTNSDTNYFTDADLSILGADWDVYEQYTIAIRKEYSIYPDLLYRPGRRKVLEYFLSMERIYKTVYFYQKFEAKAIENMQEELKQLK